MTENFLHHLWKFQKFEKKALETTAGQKIDIVRAGYHNHHAGPDFSEAKMYLGGQLWAGRVELHIRSSDWFRHGHESDAAYNNVILHVVYEHDKEINHPDGTTIPVLELKNRFDEYLYWRYEQLVQNQEGIPCATAISKVDEFAVSCMLERTLVERLEAKSQHIKTLLQKNAHDWNTTFYQWMAYGYGLKINTEPMLMLSTALPQRMLIRHKNDRCQVEALLLGTAGFLEQAPKDGYTGSLQKEYDFLRKKYDLQPLAAAQWKMARLRPPAFPEFRIAQLAGLIYQSENLLSQILAEGRIESLQKLLQKEASEYWQQHYRLGKKAARAHRAAPGDTTVKNLVINVVVPFLFVYGRERDESFYRQRAMDLLDQLPAESNSIIRYYRQLGVKTDSAFQSQALLQLHKYYCKRKKCLNCAIGNELLKG